MLPEPEGRRAPRAPNGLLPSSFRRFPSHRVVAKKPKAGTADFGLRTAGPGHRLRSWQRLVLRSALALAAASASSSAHAGGFEIPDNGTQALGRGAAFVAKASDGTAIYHNPAGLARQRGTHVLVNGNLFLHSFEFQRIGSYPDDPQDTATPWGGAAYPLAKNIAGPFFAPFLAVTTDFGYFDRLTFAAGVFGPPSIGNRTFPLGVERKPASSRYDYVQSRSSVIYPTASAGFRVTRWLDLGLSAHLVLGQFDQTTVSYLDSGPGACKSKEDFRCDSQNTLVASATSFGATIGAMVRPSPSVAFGASFRTPVNINAAGTVTPKPKEGLDLAPGAATLALQLPWMLRVGGRYIGMDADFESYDLELDVTYESWGSAQALGPIVTVPELGPLKDIQTVVQHGYKNTFGLRGGGAYNIDTGDGILSVRAGAYFDSAATGFATTRLDFDTLTKVAGTLGLGYKYGSFGFDLGYAAVASVPRLVGTGDGNIRPVNGLKNGESIGNDDQPLPAVNEGAYRGFTHIVSIGITIAIDDFFGPPRPIHYGNAYEPNYVGPVADADRDDAKKSDDEKSDAKKSDDKKNDDKKNDDKKNDDKKSDDKKNDDKKNDDKKNDDPDDEPRPEKKVTPRDDERKPEKKLRPPAPPPIAPPIPDDPEPEKPAPPPPEVKKPPKVDKPPTKRREWWEELD